jgi:acetylornithine deacetylase/succinyl-diaminopimelate desuccinylase-like protein
VVVCAHLDSVFSRQEHQIARRLQDRLTGPGIGDNALGLAVLLELASDPTASPPAVGIWLAATVGEEGLGNLRGMYALVESLRGQACAYIAVEGMTLGHVYHRGLPARRLRVSLRTSGGHSWTHAGRPSAVHELIRLADRLIHLPLPSRPRTTLNLGRIEGGTAINAIAAQASFELDLRSEDEKVVAGLESAIIHQVRSLAKPGLQVECTSIGSRPGGGLAAAHPLVAAAVASLEAQDVKDVQLGAGSTDASAPLSLGLPAVCLGVTSGSMAHSQEEMVEIAPIRRGYAAVLSTVIEAARLARAGLL